MSLFGGKQSEEATRAPAPQAPAPPVRGPTQATTGGKNVANIGKSIKIKGDLTGDEDMVIEGQVEGKVELPNAELTVGENGRVVAEVNAKSVVIVGRVQGNVNGAERVEVQATGVVDGDVTAPKLSVAEGAVVNGSIHMTRKEGAASAPTPPRPQAGTEVRKAV